MKDLPILLAACLVTLTVNGCATGGAPGEDQELALYRANAKPAVPSFRYFGTLSGWTPLATRR